MRKCYPLNFFVFFSLLGQVAMATPSVNSSCQSLFDFQDAQVSPSLLDSSQLPSRNELPLEELKALFKKQTLRLARLDIAETDKASEIVKTILESAKKLLEYHGVVYKLDPLDPNILIIDPLEDSIHESNVGTLSENESKHKVAPLNKLAASHSRIFRVRGLPDDEYSHPLMLEYNPMLLFREQASALFCEARGRLTLSNQQILEPKYDGIFAHEDTHARFFYQELAGTENHLQGFLQKSPHLKKITHAYEHEFHFDELAAYVRQIVTGLSLGEPKSKLLHYTQVARELTQGILHQDIASFTKNELPHLHDKKSGWHHRRVKKMYWGQVQQAVLFSNPKSLTRMYAFEAPLFDLSDSAKIGLSPEQLHKVESTKSIYFMIDLKYHLVGMRIHGPLTQERIPELLAVLEHKFVELHNSALALKAGFQKIEDLLGRNRTTEALNAALELKPYVLLLNEASALEESLF